MSPRRKAKPPRSVKAASGGAISMATDLAVKMNHRNQPTSAPPIRKARGRGRSKRRRSVAPAGVGRKRTASMATPSASVVWPDGRETRSSSCKRAPQMRSTQRMSTGAVSVANTISLRTSRQPSRLPTIT